MKTNFDEGCALCGSTWGDLWAPIEGEQLFFCCRICEVQLRNMAQEVKRRTGWSTIDRIDLDGDFTGRECEARQGERKFRFSIRFDGQGEIAAFQETAA